jgi:hypothetical protein
VLEPVEHLLQRELNASENGAVALRDFVRASGSASKRKDSCASGDQQWKVGDNQSQANKPTNGAGRYKEKTAGTDTARATLMDIRVQSHDCPRGIDGQDGRRNLSRIY